jgi:hypothetical protein
LFKLPYLLCDLAIALVLLRLFVDTPTGGLRATSLWLLNPISIFVFYVLGRNDSISILLIALGLLGFHRSHPLRGALGFGLVIWSRFWPVFLLPFLVVVSSGDWRKRLPILAVALAPALLYASAVAFEAVDFVDVPVISLAWSRFADHLTSFRFEMGWAQDIFVLPAGYALLLMLASVAKPHGDLLIRFSGHAFACLSLIYATSLFSPAYFTWCLLFLVILRARSNSTLLRNLHYLQILLFVPYTFYWKRTLFGYLFAPLDPEFFGSLPAPTDWLAAHGSPLVLWNLVRTGFSVTCLCMAGWVLFGGGVRVAHCGESAESEEPLAPAR